MSIIDLTPLIFYRVEINIYNHIADSTAFIDLNIGGHTYQFSNTELAVQVVDLLNLRMKNNITQLDSLESDKRNMIYQHVASKVTPAHLILENHANFNDAIDRTMLHLDRFKMTHSSYKTSSDLYGQIISDTRKIEMIDVCLDAKRMLVEAKQQELTNLLGIKEGILKQVNNGEVLSKFHLNDLTKQLIHAEENHKLSGLQVVSIHDDLELEPVNNAQDNPTNNPPPLQVPLANNNKQNSDTVAIFKLLQTSNQNRPANSGNGHITEEKPTHLIATEKSFGNHSSRLFDRKKMDTATPGAKPVNRKGPPGGPNI